MNGDIRFPTWSEWLGQKTGGAKWLVAPRLTSKMQASGYTLAVSASKMRELEQDYFAERERVAVDSGPWERIGAGPGSVHLRDARRGVAAVVASDTGTHEDAAAEIVRVLNLWRAGLLRPVDRPDMYGGAAYPNRNQTRPPCAGQSRSPTR